MIRPLAAAGIAAGAFALAFPVLAMAAPKAPPSSMPPAAAQAEAREIFAELVGINTTHNIGTAKAAQAVAARLKAAGFSGADLQVLTPAEHPTQSNVVVRLKGSGKGKPVLFECHLDVVEALAADWSLPPFQLTEKDGYFYGRGSIDMKNEDTSVLSALLRLKREGVTLDRDIIVVFTADEEGGDANGVDWLMKNHRPLVDAEYAINTEDGGGSLKGGARVDYAVQTSEKTYVTYQAEATSAGGHSSHPEPGNPIYRLAEGLVRLEHAKFPLRVNATTRGLMIAAAGHAQGQEKADLLAVANTGDEAAADRLSAGPRWNPYLRTTCVATMAQAGHAENALPQRAVVTIQCRMMPGDTQADTQQIIETALADPKIAVTVIAPAETAPESPPTPALMALFTGVARGMWPGIEVRPGMDAGASDALFSRAAGIPTYGLSGNFFEMEDNRAHGRDERVLVKSFYEDVEFNYRLMKAVSRAR